MEAAETITSLLEYFTTHRHSYEPITDEILDCYRCPVGYKTEDSARPNNHKHKELVDRGSYRPLTGREIEEICRI